MTNRTGRLATSAVATASAIALSACGILPVSTASAPTAPTTQAAPNASATVEPARLTEAVTRGNLLGHLQALQAAADSHGGNRQAGEPGFEASIDYVEEQLRQAGYDTQRQEFSYKRQTLDGATERVTTANLLADTAGSEDGTIVIGAHLDGVAGGPGINDNATGVAAALETARQFAALGVQPTHRVRFAFWSGEEDGLYGSHHYVRELADPQRTAAYLNLDMVGSPNAVPSVYGDGEGWADGSEVIEDLLVDYLTAQGTPPEIVFFEGSDHLPFAEAGIPVGGLYTGAGEDKSRGEAVRHGGTPDAPADPCYHLACDRTDAIDADVLELMADALAHATLTLSTRP